MTLTHIAVNQKNQRFFRGGIPLSEVGKIMHEKLFYSKKNPEICTPKKLYY